MIGGANSVCQVIEVSNEMSKQKNNLISTMRETIPY